VFLINGAANVGTTTIELERSGLDFERWEPVVWEASSGLVILALLPLVLALERRVPLAWSNLSRRLPLHLLGSLAFSLVHVVSMVALRKLVYVTVGRSYGFGNWPVELAYEYLKDVRTYFMFLAIAYSYRYILLRLQGEASLLAAPDVGPPVDSVERPERFLVRKLGKEFLVAVADIEWLEAQGNYINLHVRGRVYPLRSTMAAIEKRLAPEDFVRVHRSHIVNLNYLAEIEPLDTGDARLKLRDGSVVPCSRTFRSALRQYGFSSDRDASRASLNP
jgi:hypothetical protein